MSACIEALEHKTGAGYGGGDIDSCRCIAQAYKSVYGDVASDDVRSMRCRHRFNKVLNDLSNGAVLASMEPKAWMHLALLAAELQRLAAAAEGNAHVRVVNGHDTKPDSPLHQLELMNTDSGRGVHWFLLLHSRQQEGPDKHFCLDPQGEILLPAASKKYQTYAWSKTPMQELFNVRPDFKPLQQNGYDCGPGVCLLASAIIQQMGMLDGSNRHEDMTDYLHTPLSQVRMEVALHALVRTTTTKKPTKPTNPDDIIDLC